MSLTESILQRGSAERDDHFHASREATARVGKAFAYPRLSSHRWTIGEEQFKEPEVPQKPQEPLRTRSSFGLNGTKLKINFACLAGLEHPMGKYNQN